METHPSKCGKHPLQVIQTDPSLRRICPKLSLALGSLEASLHGWHLGRPSEAVKFLSLEKGPFFGWFFGAQISDAWKIQVIYCTYSRFFLFAWLRFGKMMRL